MWKWKDIPVVNDLKERKKFVIKYYTFYWSRQVGNIQGKEVRKDK